MKIGIKPLAQKVAARVQKWVGSRTPGSSVSGGGGFLSLLGFDGPGGWFQQDIKADSTGSLLEFSAVYSCLTLLAKDISKLPLRLVSLTDDGIWKEVQSPAYSPVLRKPNNYQTRIQFLSAWVVSKLIHGNTYVLLERDARGVVSGMHILDPRLVTVLVAPNGDVYYQLSGDDLARVADGLTIPAREMIHDRAECLYHPLIGVAPLVAAAMSATHGRRIQGNAVKFFENMSRPGGMLTAPGTIEQETADRMKVEFEKKFSGANMGRLFVAGDGLKYEPMNIPAIQAQLIEQLKWTGEDIARCFHVPAYKIGLGEPPTFNNISTLQQDYYNTALHTLIECIELLLDEGLGLTKGVQSLGVELDVGVLLRLDPESLAKTVESGVNSGVMRPNEGRRRMNLPPVEGGDEVYMQQQMWPLRTLQRLGTESADTPTTPPAAPTPTPPPAPSPEDQAAKLIQAISDGSRATAERVERALTDAMTGERLRTAESAAAQAKADAQAQADIAERAAADLSAARAEIVAMEKRAADAQAEATSLREKAEQAERLASLQVDLANASALEAASAASVAADLQRKVDAGDAELSAFRRQVEDLMAQAAAAADALTDANEATRSAEKRLADAQAFAKSIEAESASRLGEVARLSAEAEALRANVDVSKAVAEEARIQVEAYAAEVERARLKASEVEAAAAAEAEAAAAHLATMQAEADALRAAADDLRSKAGASDERSAADLAEADRALTAMKTQIEAERSRAEALNLRVSELQQAAKAAEEGACTHLYNLDVLRKECEAHVSEAQAAATAAEVKAEESQARAAGFERLAAEQTAQIERLLSEVTQAKTQATQAAQAEETARRLADELQSKTDALIHAEQRADALAGEKSQAEQAAQSAAAAIEAAQAEVASLRAQLAEASKSNEPKPDQRAELAEALIARLKAATETRP